jgi:hypothetical protein
MAERVAASTHRHPPPRGRPRVRLNAPQRGVKGSAPKASLALGRRGHQLAGSQKEQKKKGKKEKKKKVLFKFASQRLSKNRSGITIPPIEKLTHQNPIEILGQHYGRIFSRKKSVL